MIVLGDEQLAAMPAMALAIEAVEEALAAKAAGLLIAPPRHAVPFAGAGSLVFTVGGSMGERALAGFRAYETFAGSRQDQVVAVWSIATGRLEGVVVGEQLGVIRTGAIGGIAIRRMSSGSAANVAVIGSGLQARTQLEAASIVRPLRQVRVFSRSSERCHAFAAGMEARLKLRVLPESSAREAVADADIVICATDSRAPVIEAAWLKPGAHVNSVGPKTVDGHELDLDIALKAAMVATDSIEQTTAYDSPFFLSKAAVAVPLADLSALAGNSSVRPVGEDETTLFCSAGLAGTEVFVAAKLIAAYRDRQEAGSSNT